MEFYFIGCRSAAEATPKYMHTAFAVEINQVIYWFDAGEGCSYTAHLMGLDLLKVKEIFISHPHLDHVAGLGNLVWNIRKLSKVRGQLPVHGDIGLHIPDLGTWEGLCKVLKNTEDGLAWERNVNASQVVGGTVYEDENMTVSAAHNRHMEAKETDTQLSFSYKISCEGKTIVFSGDIKSMSDLDMILEQPCDYLFIETGHQTIEQICSYINEKDVKTLVFIHHRRDIMENMQKARMTAQRLTKCNVLFAEDGDRITV